MQRIYYKFKDDDDTFSLNIKDLGIITAGRYRGFDFGGDPVTSLPFIGGLVLGHHKTGFTYPTKADANINTPKTGVWRTRQGGIVTEDSPITVPIESNAGNDTARIDLIVGAHEYTTGGGYAAIYYAIKGENAHYGGLPEVPALTDPQREVILGQLYIGANDWVVIEAKNFTPAPVTDYGGDTGAARTDSTRPFTKVQIFKDGLGEEWRSCVFTAADNTVTVTGAGGKFVLQSGGAAPYPVIKNITAVTGATTAAGNGLQAGATITFLLFNEFVFKSLQNGGKFLLPSQKDYYGKSGDTVTFEIFPIFDDKIYLLKSGAACVENRVNKYRATQYLGGCEGILTNDYSRALNYPQDGNFIRVRSTSEDGIYSMRSYNMTLDGEEKGGVFILDVLNTTLNGFYLYDESNHVSSVPAGYKPLKTADGKGILLKGNQYAILVETPTHFQVLSVSQNSGAWWQCAAADNFFTNNVTQNPVMAGLVNGCFYLTGVLTSKTGVNVPLGTQTQVATLGFAVARGGMNILAALYNNQVVFVRVTVSGTGVFITPLNFPLVNDTFILSFDGFNFFDAL